MADCYIFTKYLTETAFLSVLIQSEAEPESPKYRSFSELQTLCGSNNCIMVIPGENLSLYSLQLPWLPEKKARLAIPYALEEKLAEPVEQLHFAFDKRYYENGEYLVAVINKQYFEGLLKLLKELHLPSETITADWFALKPSEAMIESGLALIRSADFTGTLAKEFIPFYDFKKLSNAVYCFDPSFTSKPEIKRDPEEYPLFVAQRLSQQPLFNLGQGEFQQGSAFFSTNRLFQIAAGLGFLWIMLHILTNILTLHKIHEHTQIADAYIEKIYKQYFPKASQVISPRFRIEQALKTQNNTNSTFWELLNALSIAVKNNQSQIDSIKYQTNRLQVTLKTKNFDTLEALQLALQKEKIPVKQNQAYTKDNQVIATLELQG